MNRWVWHTWTSSKANLTRRRFSSKVNLLVPWVIPEPRNKEGLLPQEISHYLILCQDSGGSLTSELLVIPPNGLWQIPAPRPSWRSHPSQRLFTAIVFPQHIPLPDARESKCWELPRALVKKWSQLVPQGAGAWRWPRECRWKKEVGNGRAFSQSHGQSGHWWPMPT